MTEQEILMALQSGMAEDDVIDLIITEAQTAIDKYNAKAEDDKLLHDLRGELVVAAIDYMCALGLTDKSSVEYTDADIEMIITALAAAEKDLFPKEKYKQPETQYREASKEEQEKIAKLFGLDGIDGLNGVLFKEKSQENTKSDEDKAIRKFVAGLFN